MAVTKSAAIKQFFSVPTRADGTSGAVTMTELKELRGIGVKDPDVKAECVKDYEYLATGAAEELGVELK